MLYIIDQSTDTSHTAEFTPVTISISAMSLVLIVCTLITIAIVVVIKVRIKYKRSRMTTIMDDTLLYLLQPGIIVT